MLRSSIPDQFNAGLRCGSRETSMTAIGSQTMRKHIFAAISLVLIATQLGGCVVYGGPGYYRPHYYHWWYR
jgi:hypothetical protein